MRFSYSKISKFLRCELAASFAYDHLLVPIRSSKKYDVGKYGHALMERALLDHHAYGRASITDEAAKQAHVKLSRDENIQLEEVDAIATLASCRETLEWMDLDNWETVSLPDGQPAVELAGVVPWHGHEFEFRIDWIAQSKKTGKDYVIDHKTTRGSLDETPPFVEFDLQLALYVAAARALGVKVDGAMLNMIGVPKRVEPDKLKSGRFSQNKSKQSMRWSLYERAVLDAGQDVETYAEMREHLQGRTWNMWRPDVTSDWGQGELLKNCHRALSRMEAISPRTALASRNPYDCPWCEYKPLCDAQFDGKPVEPFLGVVYKAKNEKSPWYGKKTFDRKGLTDYYARNTRTNQFDMDSFVP